MVNSLLVAVVSLAAIALFLAFINAIKSRKQASTGGTNGNDEKWWSMKYLWAVPITVIGVVVLWGVLGTPGSTSSGSAGTWLKTLQAPSLATVVEWKNVYWLPILIVLGVVYFLAARSEEKVVKETATAVLAISAFMLFIGFPVWVWATGPSTAPVLSMAPGGKSELVAVPSGMRVVMHGEDIRYHCMYQDGHEESFIKGEPACKDGHVPFVYATNLRTDKGNAVTYSYKKK